ncbi:cell division protein FtsQ/DivIB [Tessaracoccus sp. OH4464_COT-324]|uniref:cell division protein FtsQ/DivIB n=1 Tax=Tessaracoccus sp. OH4464_COT-324 TaxID=2491059 RepID=UPI000F633FC3|nr:FtsQ-type POTRA domain-containing protein [Tessaracoccus sp. OH4464_COT-324]RRD47540.1 FtsQ-type POTRA domain-containing protein [Tessaracoccus sp. OH4464_COT-324]
MQTPEEFVATFRDERAKKRRRRWILGGAVGGFVSAAAVVVWLFFFSSVLAAEQVSVEGAVLLEEQEILAQAEVPLGTPLALLDTRAVEERLKLLQDLRDVVVLTDYPNTVRILLTEREPVFQLPVGDSYSWVDSEGLVFRTGQARSGLLPEARTDVSDARLLVEVARAVGQLPQEVRSDLRFLEARSVDRIEFELQGDRRVIWGSADDGVLKAEVLSGLLKVSASVYDVSAPTHPTTRGR